MNAFFRIPAAVGITLTAISLITCAEMPTRSASAREVTSLPIPPRQPVATPGWADILGVAPAPEGWQVAACDAPMLLCISANGELAGTVERFSYPLSDIDLGADVEAIPGSELEFLRAWVAEHYAAIESDRQLADRSLTFTSDPPVEISVGGLPGLRYRFASTRPDGALFERYVGYVATDGARLHVFVTGIVNGDYAGVFGDSAALAEFEPYLDEIIQDLSLSERSAHLSTLAAALQAQDWEAADNETRRILQSFVHPGDNVFAEPIPTLIPPEVLQAIDQLWVEASGGRFGFSVQAEIWEDLRSQTPNDTNSVTQDFGNRVGWTRTVASQEYQFTSPDWLTEPELTYSLEAPVGHLPWAGVDWSRIEAILSTPSCGSCTIDVLYLQGDRFSRYLPSLYSWVETALSLPIPQAGSWQQAQLARQIDLRSLYPDSACPTHTTASAISPNGSLIAISSYSYERSCATPGESALAVWNAQRGTRIITLQRGPALEDFSQGSPPQEPDTEGNRIVGDVANSVAFTPDGKFIAAGMSYGVIRLWSTETWEQVQIYEGHQYAVRAIAISPDGETLVSASSDQTLKLWNLQTGERLQTIRLDESDGIVQTLLISPDAQRLATATDRNTIQLWDTQTGQLVRTVIDEAINPLPGMPVAFSPDGQILATAAPDSSVKLWNARSGARIITLQGHTKALKALAFSPEGQYLASSDGQTARLWNLSDYTTRHRFDLTQTAGHPVLPNNPGQVAFSPDGRTLATSTLLLPVIQSEPIPAPGLTLWDVATGQPVEQIREVTQFQFSPDGRFLIANGQRLQIWEPYSSRVADPERLSLNEFPVLNRRGHPATRSPKWVSL